VLHFVFSKIVLLHQEAKVARGEKVRWPVRRLP
jgi:hypothetical protein